MRVERGRGASSSSNRNIIVIVKRRINAMSTERGRRWRSNVEGQPISPTAVAPLSPRLPRGVRLQYDQTQKLLYIFFLAPVRNILRRCSINEWVRSIHDFHVGMCCVASAWGYGGSGSFKSVAGQTFITTRIFCLIVPCHFPLY